jgi:CHAD domain-containing protein
MRGVFKHLPKGLAGDEEAIHQLRVAGRRLRAALPMLSKRPEGRRVKRALRILRDLTRVAGQSRDLDVILELLERHFEGVAPLSPEQAALRRQLRSARTRSRTRMAEGLMDLEIARLRRDLRRTLARRADDVFTIRARLRGAREEQGQALLRGFALLGERYEPLELHALRRGARRLRYAAEIGDALFRSEPSEAPSLFKKIQEHIGGLHDAHVCAQWLEAQATAQDARQRPAMAAEARRLAAEFEHRARAIHEQLLRAGPAEIVAKALDEMGRSRTAA